MEHPASLEERTQTADLRLPWLHPLLGEDPARRLRGETQNPGKEVPGRSPTSRGMVQEAPSSKTAGASTGCSVRRSKGAMPTTAYGETSGHLRTSTNRLGDDGITGSWAAPAKSGAGQGYGKCLRNISPCPDLESFTANIPINSYGPSTLSETFL